MSPDTKATPTPGPWIAQGYLVVDDSCEVIVATTIYGTAKNPRVDARLIAAAPDLLAAAKLMTVALDETKYDVFIGSPSDLLRLAEGRAALLNAIAKAEGR